MTTIIKPLIECQEHIPALAKLWYEEISQHWVPNSSIEKAKLNLADHANIDKMPMAFVALQNNQPVGMACLRENDGIRPGTLPWLGSLSVHPDFRRQRVGEMLIDAVKDQAKKSGFSTIYLLAFDPTIPEWYARLGWQHIGEDKLFEYPVAVMSTQL